MGLNNKEYLADWGNLCPNCESNNVESVDSMEYDCGSAWQSVGCNDCKSTWTDVYQLSGYEKLEVPEKEEKDG
jgi:hypothetical protein